jgi:2-aminoadipate transaminase
MSTAWTSRYALRTKNIKGSAIRELLKITQRPEVISFAGGLPAPEVFPTKRFEEACHRVLQTNGASARCSPTTWLAMASERKLRTY